jgi:TonB family protein
VTLVVLRTTTTLQGIGKMATVHPLFKDKESMDSEYNKDGNTSHRPRSGGHTQAALLVLSANPAVLDIAQRAAPSGSRVVNVATIDAAMEQLRSLRPGVLLIDAASCKDISGMVAQMMQDVPELAVVVAGKSEDSASLMKLAATGQIYRFLLTPLSHSQTKLTLEAAMTQHQELGAASNRREAVAASGSNTERKNYLPAYIGLGAALIVVVAGVFYGISHMGGNNGQSVTQSATTGGPAAKELALADAALAAGKLLEPPGESALDLYRSALGIDPKNERAKGGVDNVADKLLEKAEAALTAEQLESAITILEQARDVSPGNSRLKFLDGQVARERERLKMTQAQDTTKKVRSLLNEAQEDLDAGRLISPANNNARDTIAEARRTDPTDPSIAQAQRSLNTRIIEAARRAAEQNQLEQAQSLLAAARQMGSAGADLTAVERTLSEARTATAVARPTPPPPAPVAVAPTPAPTPAEPPKPETAATTSASAAAAAAVPPVTLKRIKTVTPTFPEEAKKRGLSGWVEVSFVVMPNGNVDSVKVQNSEPKAVFDFAAIQAVEQWRFEPPMRNGKPASQMTKIKLRFDIPK